MKESSKYIIATLKCKNVGPAKLLKYIKESNFDLNVFKKKLVTFLSDENYENYENYLRSAEIEISQNKNNQIEIITIFDENFPRKLYASSDPVLYLYYKGNVELLNVDSLAIIGTRKPSDKSLARAFEAGRMFAKKNIPIVSGLALGVDSEAHKGVMSVQGQAIGVLPSDLKKIAPAASKLLAEEILKNNGCLVSEYSVGSIIDKYCFVKRDRIQSFLSNSILVIEAKENSGTMIAVNKSLKDLKPVFQLMENENALIKNKIDLDEVGINEIISCVKAPKKDKLNYEQPKLF